MSLEEYLKKRDFKKTTEPQGASKRGKSSRFVIQEHRASHLHYDFRLEEYDTEAGVSVLRSWAIPKNIPKEKGIRRLAVRTEDHPVEYLSFEGIIPEGEYGAGQVKIWDSGKWKMIKGGLHDDSLTFHLEGRKIKGDYILVKFYGAEPKPSKSDTWLIWKTKSQKLNP